MEDSKTNEVITSNLFEFRTVERKRLFISMAITLIVMLLEIIGGILVNSLALISDAGHMFTHAFAIGISILAILIARKPPCHHKTFGLYRAEVLAAFINGLFLIFVVIIIIYESILRFLHPQAVEGIYMFLIALIGLATNLASIIILNKSKNASLNVRSVFYHMFADAISSIAIVAVAIIISYSRLYLLDPLASILISIVILYWAWSILKESVRILLEMSPRGLNIDIIEKAIKQSFNEVSDVFHSHLWTIIPGMLVFSTHIILNEDNPRNSGNLIAEIRDFLTNNYNIGECTIQIDTSDHIEACYFT
jgi:cobalt-zinc-cadmium efflux system protein